MEIVRADRADVSAIAPLAAAFRATLSSFRGVEAEPDAAAGEEELNEFLDRGCPVFAAKDGGEFLGYIVFRIDEPCLWVEQFFVRPDRRRNGVGTLLFEKAEETAASMGEDTVYNFVHPNNDRMIAFLRSKGYTVLNMLEIRKPYSGEEPTSRIKVADNEFDY
ncbi:MAG: GNAT family N-acetyltransferase [Clostridia bacterium]|nr:GNAT family N-acetyltransferase [Clostridia bacterium]